MPQIEFCLRGDLIPLLPHPIPAAKSVPEWLRNMPLDRNGPTVKRCPPFLDAMTTGYFIPLIADVELRHTSEGIQVESRMPVPPVLGHFMEQLADTPFAAGLPANTKVLKFNNPWMVKTPPGYSSLFLPPMNVPPLPFITQVSGVVETDLFYSEVNIPFLLSLPIGQSMELKAGTPIIQVIPLRREEWKSELTPSDPAELEKAHRELQTVEHCYRERHWVKKSYL